MDNTPTSSENDPLEPKVIEPTEKANEPVIPATLPSTEKPAVLLATKKDEDSEVKGDFDSGGGFREFISTVGILLTALAVALLMIMFVFRSYQVDGPSM